VYCVADTNLGTPISGERQRHPPTLHRTRALEDTLAHDGTRRTHQVTRTPLAPLIPTTLLTTSRLTRIVSLVLRDLYPIRPPSLSVRMELSAKYTKDLDVWRAALSPFLDGTGFESSLLIPIYQRQRGVLNLAYYHAMLLIHRPFLLSDFANLTHITSQPLPRRPSTAASSASIASCLDAAMNIVRVVDTVFASSNLFRAFWFTQYYAFCAVVVLYIYRIQQHLETPGTCEGYFSAGQKCQRQLETISQSDCLARRYCLVLEELRLEAMRQTNSPLGLDAQQQQTTAAATVAPQDGSEVPLVQQQQQQQQQQQVSASTATQQHQGEGLAGGSFYGGMPTGPESAGGGLYNTDYVPSNSIMADLTSWGQFDSLVTAGIGIFDGGFQGDTGFGFGFGL
jgi:energy-converting hydrogenase Eha subunit F